MDLNEAMRTGLPIAIGGAIGRHPDDREDMIEEAVLPALAESDVGIEEGEGPALETVVYAEADTPQAPPSVPPGPLEAEVEAILQRISTIEARMRERLGLHRIHEALDRLETALK